MSDYNINTDASGLAARLEAYAAGEDEDIWLAGLCRESAAELTRMAAEIASIGAPTDAADPTGSVYARLKWWRDRSDEQHNRISELETALFGPEAEIERMSAVIERWRDSNNRLRAELEHQAREARELRSFVDALRGITTRPIDASDAMDDVEELLSGVTFAATITGSNKRKGFEMPAEGNGDGLPDARHPRESIDATRGPQ